tara:strand:+ start:508 stop:693 length:186 start_codon:yes stop_codon:yes gene_type:complete
MVEDMEVATIHLLNPRPLLRMVDPAVAVAVQHLMLVELEIHQLNLHHKEILADQDIMVIHM